jgi:hypothetical protein
MANYALHTICRLMQILCMKHSWLKRLGVSHVFGWCHPYAFIAGLVFLTCRVGQNHIYTPFVTVYLVISGFPAQNTVYVP